MLSFSIQNSPILLPPQPEQSEKPYQWGFRAFCAVLCLALGNPMDFSPPRASAHGDSPGKNTGLGCHALLQRIFPTQGSNPGVLHCRRILSCLNHQGSPCNALYPCNITSSFSSPFPPCSSYNAWFLDPLLPVFAPTVSSIWDVLHPFLSWVHLSGKWKSKIVSQSVMSNSLATPWTV